MAIHRVAPILIIIFFNLENIFSQQLNPSVSCAASGAMSNGNTTIYWTIGETVTKTLGASPKLLSSGFEQSGYTITAVKNNLSALEIKLFPNPALDHLSIQMNDFNLENGSYELFDTLGEIISAGKLVNDITDINCSQLHPAK